MDFHARQYDPQIGRFLGVDPLAASAGQDMFSPYAAMGNAPESMVDPNGLQFSFSGMGNPMLGDPFGLNGSRFGGFNIDGSKAGAGGPSGGGGGGGYVDDNGDWVYDGSSFGTHRSVGASGETTGQMIDRAVVAAGGLVGYKSVQGEGNAANNLTNGGSTDGGKAVQQGYGDIAIFFSGADFGQGMTPTVTEIAEAVADGRHLEYSVYSSSYYLGHEANTDGAFSQIMDMKERFPEGGRVLLYGYSYGGVEVNYLAKRLEKAGVAVNYMATVDAANGWGSDKVNRTVGNNVKRNDNFYQTNTSFTRDPTMSHGGPNTGNTNINNYHMKGVTHMSIDEATSNIIIRSMRTFLTR